VTLDSSATHSEADLRLVAMNYLARREHSARELKDKLAARCDDAVLVDRVVHRLGEEGLQSDERFVEGFVRSRLQQGKGPLRIEQELRRKGVSESLAQMGLAQADVDWHQQARRVRDKRFGPSLPQDLKAKAKQLWFLQYRGFTADQAYAALET